jgi:hypothetical protein
MPPLHIPGEARALIAELGEPVPRVLLDRYFARVSALLSADETLIPAKVVEVCQKVQIELLIAPVADLEQPYRPSTQPPRSPFRRRG